MSQEAGRLNQSPSLPDSLTGLDRPSGNPDSLYEMGKDFGRAAGELDAIDRDEYRLLLEVHGPWEGVAAKGFVATMTQRQAAYSDVAAGYRTAAGAVKDYASALENAQNTYAASRALNDNDYHRQTSLRSKNPAYSYDLFSADRVRARSQLEAALERLRGATVRTTGMLKALESTMGKRPPVLPDIYRGKGSSFMQAGDEVGQKIGEDVQAACNTYRLVQPGQAKDAWRQALDEYLADRARFARNPVTYVGDELYSVANIEEFQAGNYARGLAGAGYNVVTRGPSKLMRLFSPDGKRKQDGDKKAEEKKSWCSPG